MNEAVATKCGYVALIGRPNSGKSSILNWLIDDDLAMVSHKANATRKRMNIIVNSGNTQIIFIDSPGIHRKERILNKFMLEESMKAMSDSDITLFITPINDEVKYYLEFLDQIKEKKHILVLTKIDLYKPEKILNKISEYNSVNSSNRFLEIIPVSSKRDINREKFIDLVSKYLPESPHFFEDEYATDSNLREIYKEVVRGVIFEKFSAEIPYSVDTITKSFESKDTLDKIVIDIIVEKESQKIIIVGKNGENIKKIGILSRKKMEFIGNKKVYLELSVKVDKNWSRSVEKIKKIGYVTKT